MGMGCEDVSEFMEVAEGRPFQTDIMAEKETCLREAHAANYELEKKICQAELSAARQAKEDSEEIRQAELSAARQARARREAAMGCEDVSEFMEVAEGRPFQTDIMAEKESCLREAHAA